MEGERERSQSGALTLSLGFPAAHILEKSNRREKSGRAVMSSVLSILFRNYGDVWVVVSSSWLA